MPGKQGSIEERFWPKVDRSGGHDACWEWQAGRFPSGYGVFSAGSSRKSVRAHRMAWELTYGDPGPALVLHKCDNRPCCNPRHLYLGDHTQNMKDAKDRGRLHHGETHPKSKLTPEQVTDLRLRYLLGHGTMEQLGKQYGINKASARQIIRRLSWRHL